MVLELEKHEYDEIVGKIADPELRKEAELATSFFELTHVEHAVTMQVVQLKHFYDPPLLALASFSKIVFLSPMMS